MIGKIQEEIFKNREFFDNKKKKVNFPESTYPLYKEICMVYSLFYNKELYEKQIACRNCFGKNIKRGEILWITQKNPCGATVSGKEKSR